MKLWKMKNVIQILHRPNHLIQAPVKIVLILKIMWKKLSFTFDIWSRWIQILKMRISIKILMMTLKLIKLRNLLSFASLKISPQSSKNIIAACRESEGMLWRLNSLMKVKEVHLKELREVYLMIQWSMTSRE